ncbi:hypothetical protein C5167_000861 [Papaver somniferum]|uniref:phosphopyruvate hydratase n=1 Tax=Papaver somniferum TaxID=3469 RepID=A0A4Y7KTT2_PAPSO|nr:hypothetical protein C5167_000861 [Papaver somniferum]
MPSLTEGFNLVKEPIDGGDYSDRIKIAMDVAATDFCVGTPNSIWFTVLCLLSLEDPFDKDGWKDTQLFTCLGIFQVNQIGTVTGIVEAVKLAKNANWGVSDHLARGEQLAKYNQLLWIEEELDDQAV